MLVFGPCFSQRMYRFHTLSRRIANNKRRLIITEMRESKLFRLQNIIRGTLDQKPNPTTDEWHELQHKLLNFNWSLDRSLIDRMILENCFPDKLDTGKSYMDYLKQSKQKLHQNVSIVMLHMYYNASKCGFEITDRQQGHIIEMCQYLHGKHTLFSSSLAAAVILGFVLTPHWRKSLDILDSLRASTPSMAAYIALVQRAIQEKDEHLVWNIFERITAHRLCLNNDLFALYLGHCETNATTFKENVDKILTTIGTKRILVSEEAANEIQRVFHRFHYRCDITTVNVRGVCHLCGKRLRRRNDVKLTDDEFNRLRNRFWDNISTKSTTNELESFRPYVDGTGKYDIVIDGLNMRTIHWRPTENDSKCGYELKLTQLAHVVKYFADRKKKVLVIGRQYMNEWSKAQMDYIGEHADIFLTEDSSDDDQFFIYSALKSGPNTNIITRDALQNHAHLFDEQLRTVFRRWQQQHQYSVKSVEDPDIVEFDDRIEFDMNAQQMDDGCWHIPFRSDSRFRFQQDDIFKLWKNWLCVSKE